jgi:osmotically-inducible protein OsmY
MSLIKRVSACLIAVLLAAGCASNGELAVGAFFDDASITSRVKTAIYKEPSLKVTQISVTTEDKVVHLTGEVGSRAEIRKATDVARSVEGVKSVKNALKVKH